MGTPYLGQLKIVAFNFPPRGWAYCNGQTLQIQQNQALFSLLGTTYGGNGVQTFNLPNLQGSVPVHTGGGQVLGGTGGALEVTLSVAELPEHVHELTAVSSAATSGSPLNNLLATTPIKGMGSIYGASPNGATASTSAISDSGGSHPHVNTQPYLTLNFVIALQGIFPSRS